LPDLDALSKSLAQWLDRTTFPDSGTRLRCGVSGGADSLALMALGVAARCDVTAVHVDHGQREDGANEARLVERCALDVGADFESVRVQVPPGSNLEARMRAARRSELGPDAATGHTADDQAETLLINLLRGTGLAGLGAMRVGPRCPILALRRTDTEAICSMMGWTPFVDPSNLDPTFTRNRIRHEVMPLLIDVANRDVVPLLTRAADHARSAATALDEMASDIDPRDARVLAAAPPAVAAAAVQRWVLAETGAEHPIDAAAIARVLAVAAGDAVAAEVIGGWRVSRSNQRLSIS